MRIKLSILRNESNQVNSTVDQTILVVGGAGYIGSHMSLALQKAGYRVVVLDNLSKGHRDAVIGAELVEADMADKAAVSAIFDQHAISAVMHFASFIEVGESVRLPAKYYQNNVAATLNLLDVMLAHQVKRFIFSSTAAVYGEPQYTPMDEAHPLAPVNPYGRSKLMVETILKDYARSDDLQYAVLRYFNAAGADPEGRLAERHEPESHLIPLVLQSALGLRKAITIFGGDYSTPDGTCLRDYVHVSDLGQAHLLALEALQQGCRDMTYNLGTGQGYSVQEVIETARKVTGREITVIHGERRDGDPAALIANPTAAMKALNWQPQFSSLEIIIRHAWQVMQTSNQIADAV